MSPVLFEVRCNLTHDDPKWKEITSLFLEIGYPGRAGNTLWKHIGWLHDKGNPVGRNFAHALWSQDMTNHVLVFDFLPVINPEDAQTEMTYRIRKNITRQDGRLQTSQSHLLSGDYADEFFSLHPKYPEHAD